MRIEYRVLIDGMAERTEVLPFEAIKAAREFKQADPSAVVSIVLVEVVPEMTESLLGDQS